MKKSILPLAACAAMLFSFSSCGSGSATNANDSTPDSVTDAPKAPEVKFEDVCKEGNGMALTIKDYKYGMSGKYAFETGNFEVKESSFRMLNDSAAELRLMNYAASELVGERKDEQVEILAKLYARNGKKIGPGVYPKGASDKDMWSQVTMTTAKGTVYFNWLMGMPESGNVVLDYVSSDQACGKFELSAEKPDNEQIGTVRLNGKFSVE
jgi:hypothetical protein